MVKGLFVKILAGTLLTAVVTGIGTTVVIKNGTRIKNAFGKKEPKQIPEQKK